MVQGRSSSELSALAGGFTYHTGCIDRRDVDGHNSDNQTVNEEFFAFRLVHDPLQHVVLGDGSTIEMHNTDGEMLFAQACLAIPCHTAS